MTKEQVIIEAKTMYLKGCSFECIINWAMEWQKEFDLEEKPLVDVQEEVKKAVDKRRKVDTHIACECLHTLMDNGMADFKDIQKADDFMFHTMMD